MLGIRTSCKRNQIQEKKYAIDLTWLNRREERKCLQLYSKRLAAMFTHANTHTHTCHTARPARHRHQHHHECKMYVSITGKPHQIITTADEPYEWMDGWRKRSWTVQTDEYCILFSIHISKFVHILYSYENLFASPPPPPPLSLCTHDSNENVHYKITGRIILCA